MFMSSIAAYPHIFSDPAICGGTPCIQGHRIRVLDVAVEHEFEGLSPEEICGQHPGLSLAEVHAALTYFYDHRAVILAAIDAEQRAVDAYRKDHPDRAL
jgi:uncharacterized protein (DUF433 family)